MKLKYKLKLIRALLLAFVLSYFLSSCAASYGYSCKDSTYAKNKSRYTKSHRYR